MVVSLRGRHKEVQLLVLMKLENPWSYWPKEAEEQSVGTLKEWLSQKMIEVMLQYWLSARIREIFGYCHRYFDPIYKLWRLMRSYHLEWWCQRQYGQLKCLFSLRSRRLLSLMQVHRLFHLQLLQQYHPIIWDQQP